MLKLMLLAPRPLPMAKMLLLHARALRGALAQGCTSDTQRAQAMLRKTMLPPLHPC